MFEWLKKWWRYRFVSDNKPKITDSLVSSSVHQMFNKTKAYYGNSIKLADTDYYKVDKDWLLGPWYNYYKKLLSGLNIKGWSEDFDCDNFADLYMATVQVCHKVNNVDKGGLAVGVVWYVQDSGGGHAINVAVINAMSELLFIEPQSGEVLCLTNTEFRSIYFVRF